MNPLHDSAGAPGANRTSRIRQAPRATLAGLALALAAPVIYAFLAITVLFSEQATARVEIGIGLIVMWVLAVSVWLIIIIAEKRPLSSIGWAKPSAGSTLQFIGIGVVLSLAVPALSMLAGMIVPAGESGSIESAVTIPWQLMLMSVATAAVTEEILFRGYALERLLEWSGSKWIASLVSLAGFTAIHAGGWNAAHIIGVVLPLGAILIGLYWWKRNLILVMIAHFTINLPLVFLAFRTGA